MEKRRTVVLASGVFDLLHYGHLKFLEKAKEAGGSNAKLVVVIARDSTIIRMKGVPPVLPEEQRKAIIEALKPVDVAVLGYEGFNIPAIIEEYHPDIIAVGYDQVEVEKKVREIVESKGYPVRIVRIGHYGQGEFDSSTKIKKKILSRMQ